MTRQTNSTAKKNKLNNRESWQDQADINFQCSTFCQRTHIQNNLCWLTACVTGGWGEQAHETENCQSSETAQKRAESQPSGARCVGRLLLNCFPRAFDSNQYFYQENKKYYSREQSWPSKVIFPKGKHSRKNPKTYNNFAE